MQHACVRLFDGVVVGVCVLFLYFVWLIARMMIMQSGEEGGRVRVDP